MKTINRRWTVFSLLCVTTIVLVVWALGAAYMSGIGVYDYNFEAFHDVLTPEQGSRILRQHTALMLGTIVPLAIGNLGWMVTTWRLLSRLDKTSSQDAP